MESPERKIFGTDGVRGRSNQGHMTSDMALALGRAAADVLRRGRHRHRIVIGKDTRLSGYMFETALASGITSMGTDVMLAGPLPTPGIAFITRGMRADAGIVISGSHNNWQDNGIKFFDRNGFKLDDSIELEIESRIVNNHLNSKLVPAEQIGRALRVDDATGRYIQFLKGTFPSELSLDGLKIVVDCANGAGYRVAPNVFEELGAKVISLAVDPDGNNINLDCGSLHVEGLCKKVKEIGADCGVALDGDADRVIMCDESGEIIDGDVIMALAAINMQKQGSLKKNTLVATVMSNLALDHAMEEKGIKVIRSNVGDKYVVQEMLKGGFNLGGEQSGHMIFLDDNTTGDGCLAALRILNIMLEKNKPLSDLKNIFSPYPQSILNIKVKLKTPFSQIPEVAKSISEEEARLSGKGRLLVRYSGTENIARVMVEAREPSLIETVEQNISEVINKHLGV